MHIFWKKTFEKFAGSEKSVTFAHEFKKHLLKDKQNNFIINYKWISYYDSHNIQQTERSEG